MKKLWAGLSGLVAAIAYVIHETWEYIPNQLQNAWKLTPVVFLVVAVIALAGLAGSSAYWRLNDNSVYAARQAAKAPPEQQQRLEIARAKEGNKLIASVPVAPGLNLFVVASEGEYRNGVLVREVTAVAPDGDAPMKVALLYDRSSWAKDSSTMFEQPGSEDKSILDVLREEPIRNTVVSAREIYCFGLASSEPSDNNEFLAQTRGQRLCEALAELGYVDVDRQAVYSVPLGTAMDNATGDEARKQRAAVIVGVQESYRGVHFDHYVRAITATTKSNSVALDRYAPDPQGRYDGFVLEKLVGTRDMHGRGFWNWRRLSAAMKEVSHHGRSAE